MATKGPAKNRKLKKGKSALTTRWKSRLLDVAILGSAVVVGIFIFSIAGRLSTSWAERDQHPPRVLRIQILNGCGEQGLAADFALQLRRAHVDEFRFEIVDRDNFDHFEVENSFLIVYTLSMPDARRLISKWGLVADKIQFAEQSSNPWGVDLTIVLGNQTKPQLADVVQARPTP